MPTLPARLIIAADLHTQMLAHCQRVWPLEACGLFALAGVSGSAGEVAEVVALWPGTNVLESATRFRMDAHEVAQGIWQFEVERGWVAGVYHSHPNGPARLSATDLAELACAWNVLVAWSDAAHPLVQAFCVDWDTRDVRAVPLVVA